MTADAVGYDAPDFTAIIPDGQGREIRVLCRQLPRAVDPLEPFDGQFTVHNGNDYIVGLRGDSPVDDEQIDSPAARTKNVAAGLRIRCSLRSSLPSMWSSAGLGKPASTGEPNNGSSSGVGYSTKRSTFQVPE